MKYILVYLKIEKEKRNKITNRKQKEKPEKREKPPKKSAKKGDIRKKYPPVGNLTYPQYPKSLFFKIKRFKRVLCVRVDKYTQNTISLNLPP